MPNLTLCRSMAVAALLALAACGADGAPKAPEAPAKTGVTISGEVAVGVTTQ